MIAVENHFLVPKHNILPKEEAEKLMKELNSSQTQLPLILKNDPAIKKLKAQIGDIIRIERESFTAGKSIYYRIVK